MDPFLNHLLTALMAAKDILLQHGSIGLFFLLALGIIGLPVPDETLLASAGFLIARGKLALSSTLTAGYLGALCGITGSYVIGLTAGSFLVKKYGTWIGLTEKRIAKAHYWFDRVGIWALFFGYFIPGVRHLTGYIAGALRETYPRFALFAYSGAFVWASTFLALGYYLGHN